MKARLTSTSINVATILDQQSFLHAPTPFHHLTFALLPKSFRRLKRLVGHHLPVFTTLFDHTARFIITGSDDNLVKIWSTETAYLQYTLRGHDGDITEIVKHPTRPIIVSASSDTTLRVWNINTGAALYALDGGTKEVNSVQFSPCPDRPYLVSGNADGTVRLWNADNFEASFVTIPIPRRSVVRHATDTRQAGTATTSTAAPSSPINHNHNHPQPIPRQAPSSSAQPAPSVAPRNAAHSTVSGTPNYEVLCVGFNAGATRLAVSGTDCAAHVYALDPPADPNTPFPRVRLLTSLRGHNDHIIQVAFSRSGGTIVTACRDGTARIWKRVRARLPNSKNNKRLVEGMGSWSCKILDCRSQIQADARSLLSGGASGSACGSIVPRLRRASFPVSVCAAMWSRNDRYLFTASSDTKIRIWHAETGQLARVLEAHESEVYVMDCHPTDERILLSAGYDGRCILWDIETGKMLRSFNITNQHGEQGASAGPVLCPRRPSICDGQFSCDGLSFVVSDTSGAITVFGVGSGEATALAPEEQFFSRDCAPFRRDQQNRALDENTSQLLHIVPKGRLCDKEFRPHPPELQPSMPAQRPLGAIASSKEHDSDKIRLPSSPNTVENKNRDALLQRAKEFRENQEKEERRLLREARYTRRRMIIERGKTSLAQDRLCLIPLREFEVPGSDYEDDDEDFTGQFLESSGSESSTSSSEEEDEIQPVRRKRKLVRLDSEEGGAFAGVRKRARRSTRRRRTTEVQTKSSDSGPSEGGYESPEYIRSDEGESESSGSSAERDAEKGNERISRLIRLEESNDQHLDGEASLRQKESSVPMTSSPSIGGYSLAGPLPKLASAMTPASRRMKIKIPKQAGLSQSLEGEASNPAVSKDQSVDLRMISRETASNPPPIHGANSVGSHHMQAHVSEAGAIANVATPINPSYTSERKDNANSYAPRRNTLEEHQGDSASCFRPRGRVMEDGNDANMRDEHPNAQHSSGQRSPETQKGQHSHMAMVANTNPSSINNATSKMNGKADGIEKSLLSDSPIRLTRRRWRRRTRNGSANLEIDGPVLDIDEVAERELEILDAQRSHRHRRKRRRSFHSDSSGGNDSLDGHERSRRRSIVDTDEGFRHKRQKRRGRKYENLGNDAEHDLALKGSAWLRLCTNKHTYVPQVGDDVMYFPEGHVAAMDVSRAAGIEPLVDKLSSRKLGKEVLDGSTFGEGASPVRMTVLHISYEFSKEYLETKNSKSRPNRSSADPKSARQKTMAVLTLRLISGLRRRANQSDRFVLAYFPVDAPEYLVLSGRVEAALNRSWKASDRFRILFLNEMRAWQYYTGTIRNVKPTIRTVLWNSIEVEYDKTEAEKDKVNVDLVSPWELESHDIFQASRDSGVLYGQVARSSTVDPGLFPIIARELETIRQMEPRWRTHLSWLDTVDNLALPSGYVDVIPYPLDLNTVLVRLCTGYYRHFAAFTHDVETLRSNAGRFHGEHSEMGALAIDVFSRIAETAERIRAQMTPPFIHVAQPPEAQHSQHVNHSGSRAIRPRPTQGEMHGTGPGYQTGHGGARQFPVPLTPRQSSSIYETSAHRMMTQSQKAWNASKMYAGSSPGQILYTNNTLGIALPPVLPSVSTMGATSKGGRGAKSNGQGQPIRPNTAQARRGISNILPRGQGPAPIHPGTLGVPGPSAPFPLPYYPQPVNAGHYPHSQVRMVASSSQTTNIGRGGARLLAPGSSHQHNMAKNSTQSARATPIAMSPAVMPNILVNNVRLQQQSGPASPTAEGMLPPAAASILGTSISFGQGPHLRRAGSNGADGGGTHSWSRSMEGAGGVFPLQASTSDSHLPTPPQGTSQSPRSPATNGADNVGAASGAQGTGHRRKQYHEHSTVSIAAAESTMSCGGAEFQAAESADNASEQLATNR